MSVEQGLRISVLGPVRAWLGDVEVSLGQPQTLAVAAMLAMRSGRPVRLDELVDGVFGSGLPGQPRQAIHTQVSRLRRALGADAITTVGGGDGYVLHLLPEDLDLWQCEHVLESAADLSADGAYAEAAGRYAAVVKLLDSGALAGVPGPAAEAARTRLAEVRLSAIEDYLELRLRLGQHSAVAAELVGLVEAHPLRERLYQLLMLARYRCGRQAEALAVHAGLRRLLDEELGIRPSAETESMFRRILQHDPDLALPVAAKSARQTRGESVPTPTPTPTPGSDHPSSPVGTPASPQRAPLPVPRQLPAAVSTFVGRAEELARFTATLSSPGPGAPMVAVATGMGGVGKTALAVRAAHAVSAWYPDGQLYIDLRGAGDDPVDPALALTTMLRAFGLTAPPEAGVGELAALFRTATADRRILLLLDNAANAAQVSPLMPGTPGSAVLVTSRRVLQELCADCCLEVAIFDEAQALELLGTVVGTSRVDEDRQAASEVVGLCGGLPLALRIAGARLAARPAWTMRSLVDRLADKRRRLGELRAGELAVTTVFELGYAQLDPEQARTFRLIGAVDTPDLSLAALAAVLNRPVDEAESLAELLVDAGMAQSPSPGRYRLHDLLRLFAAERAADPAEGRRAVADLLGFFVATMHGCGHLGGMVKGAYYLSALRADDDAPKVLLRTGEEVSMWIIEELPVVTAVLGRLAAPGARQPEPDGELLDLAADCLLGLSAIVPVNSRRELYTTATALAEAAGDHAARARIDLAHLELLTFAGQLGKVRALLPGTASAVAGDDVVALMHLNILSYSEFWQGDYESALAAALDQSALAERLGNRLQQATALHFASRIHSALGDGTAALVAWEGAREADPDPGWNLYGTVARAIALQTLGRFEEALDAFRHLADQMRQIGAHDEVQSAVRGEAECLRLAGRPAEALPLAESSLAMAEQLADDLDQGRALAVLGLVLADLGRLEESRGCTERAATFFGAMGLPTDVPSLYVH